MSWFSEKRDRFAAWGSNTLMSKSDTFAKNFAKGGYGQAVLSDSPNKAFWAALKGPVEYGSRAHKQSYMRLADKLRFSEQRKSAFLHSASKRNVVTKGGSMIMKKGMGLAGVGFVTMFGPARPWEQRTAHGKIGAVARNTAAEVGWHAGGRAGMAIGAYAGSSIVPIIGTAIGAGVGYVVGAFAGALGVDKAFVGAQNKLNSMAEESKRRRMSMWIGSLEAFNTQSAMTMRQRAFSQMNRGMMTGRSALGREAAIIHS